MTTTTGRDQQAAARAEEARDAAWAARGDVAAFERLYRHHVARIHGLARRMVGPEESDDATQEIFIRAWEKLHTFRGDSAFGTWLHRLAVNVLLARRSTLATRRQRFQEDDGVLDGKAGQGIAHELRVDFETAIARLPSGAREVFVLHDVEGYKHEEIADLLGISPGTSKSQLHRARMALRAYLDR